MIGVIADDLTGASELGGIGVRRGLKVEIVIRGEFAGDADLLCVDTDSRACRAREAGRRAAAAARKLRKAGAALIYKKVDSVLRGNVLTEVRAIQKALGLRSALLIPANPRFGRVIRDGQYFVKGKPIHQTDFARDPEYPRRSPNVLKMLGVTMAREVSVTRLAKYRHGSGIVLGEVSSSADVQKWAFQRRSDMLLAGGAEFFEAVLKTSGSFEGMTMEPPHVGCYEVHGTRAWKVRRELFICGSTSDYTEQFVSEARRAGTPVFSLIERNKRSFDPTPAMLKSVAEKSLLAFESHLRVILAVGRPLVESPSVARKLSGLLVKIAVNVIEQAKPNHVFAEGGATAAELVRQLGWTRLRVLQELAPGVTTLALLGRHAPLLTIKPGSYPGWPK